MPDPDARRGGDTRMSDGARPWEPTGEYRVAPWHFGLMRAEQQERRERRDSLPRPGDVEGEDNGGWFQLRWVAFKPPAYEVERMNYGFYSLMAGDSVMRRFITWFKHTRQLPKDPPPSNC